MMYLVVFAVGLGVGVAGAVVYCWLTAYDDDALKRGLMKQYGTLPDAGNRRRGAAYPWRANKQASQSGRVV